MLPRMSGPSTLGLCPRCDETITRDGLLAASERGEATVTVAECPGCREFVTPELVTVPSLEPR